MKIVRQWMGFEPSRRTRCVGQGLAEYGLMMALMGAVVMATATPLSEGIQGHLDRLENAIVQVRGAMGHPRH